MSANVPYEKQGLACLFVFAICIVGLLALLAGFNIGEPIPPPLDPTLVVQSRQARESTLQALVDTTGFVSVRCPCWRTQCSW